MLFAIVPVINGEPDMDWSNPPMESFQPNDTQRYCGFLDTVEVRPSWQLITEDEYNQAKPVSEPMPEPAPEPTNAEIQQQLNLVLQGLALLSVQ
jgi:hypothetical protein